MATYPKAISSWTNRIDGVNTVWAADPNELAAEIIALEKAVGTMPNVEGKPPVGNPVTYGSMSARLTDTLLGNQLPYVELTTDSFNLTFQATSLDHGQFISYKPSYDPSKYFNGSDLTIRADGLYLLSSYVTWEYYNTGYVMSALVIDGVNSTSDRWDWDFPTSGPSDANYSGRWATTQWTWFGALQKGARVRVIAENGTPKNPYRVINSYLRCHYLRALPGSVHNN